MIKAEAIQAIENGQKVTHEYFTDKEWVCLDESGMYKTEDGYLTDQSVFWAYRTDISWETGWSVFEEPESILSNIDPDRKNRPFIFINPYAHLMQDKDKTRSGPCRRHEYVKHVEKDDGPIIKVIWICKHCEKHLS